MLVVSRKSGETIRIGEAVKVVVTRIDGNRVYLGIEAPADVVILRGEVAEEEPGLPGLPDLTPSPKEKA